MTLVLALANSQYAVVAADHRLTVDGTLHDVEAIKLGLLTCHDARALFGFSGLAQAGSFKTDLWFLGEFAECGPPDFLMGPILERVRERASSKIARIPTRSARDRRLSFLIAGYHYAEDPPRLNVTLLSNFERNNAYRTESSDEFELLHGRDRRPRTGPEPASIRIAGAQQAVEREDLGRLLESLEDREHPSKMAAQAVQVIRRAAANPKSRGTIGTRCFSAVLPCDPVEEIIAENHIDENTTRMYGLPHAIATKEISLAVAEPTIIAEEVEGGWVPNVGRNKRCPCGSGKKYKFCHGR